MRSLTKPSLVFLPVFATLFVAQFGVHLVANDALAVLLPGDGCGQVLDLRLQTLVKIVLWVAYTAAALAAFSCATIVAFGWGRTLFVLSALASIVAFLVGGITNIRFSEHLNSCDMFFMGRDSPYLNFGAAGLLLILITAVLYKASSK
jgi:hypothetical protein